MTGTPSPTTVQIAATNIVGLVRIRAAQFPDPRGTFTRFLDTSSLAGSGIDLSSIEQIGASMSAKGVARGLHTRVSPGETKFVRCTKGAIFDVAVDLRPWSPSFRTWQSFDLNEETPEHLWFPVGVAHGFQALADDTEVTYLLGGEHRPDDERVIALDDPQLGIPWPLPVGERSARDAAAPSLHEVEAQLLTWFPEQTSKE